MEKKTLRGKDILLILLYLPGTTEYYNEPIVGRTRLTKMMFIFNEELHDKFDEIDEENLPEFFAYDYGPFSKELLDDVRFFVEIGFVEEKSEESNENLTEAEIAEYLYDINDDRGFENNLDIFDIEPPDLVSFELTDKGEKFVEEKLLDHLDQNQIDILKKFKRKINSLSLDSILEYVYNKYPDKTKNSKIKDKYIH